MKNRIVTLAAGMLLLAGVSSQASTTITIGHNSSADAKDSFKFKNLPLPATNNAARTAKFVIVDGEMDPNGGDVAKLNDGKLPEDEDQPEENFFFNAGTSGGRLRMDLASAISVRQINTYSWHANTRAPQVYKLYVSDGSAADFNPAPKRGTNPETCGWKLLANVNTKPKDSDDAGGQYGVSISDPDGPLGKYSHLLFDMSNTEDQDEFGNTFYSEINVIDASSKVEAAAATAEVPPYVFKTADGQCEITINSAAAPDLTDWAKTKLAPALTEWYPKIVALLPSPDYNAPSHFTITFKPMDGVAYTSGRNVVANSDWISKEIGREAVGSIIHEAVHVVQQIHGGGVGWMVEGSADYIRWFKYEPQSHGADVTYFKRARKLAPKYDGSYRITANFLNYVSEKYDKDLVTQMNAAMRDRKYNVDLWKEYTGKTLADLGDEWKTDLLAQIAAANGTAPAAKP